MKKYTYQQAVEHALKLYPQHTVECVPFTSLDMPMWRIECADPVTLHVVYLHLHRAPEEEPS